jgi:hypothetical protein
MRSGDDVDFNADVQLRDTKPNTFVRYYQFGTSTQAGWNFGGIRQYFRVSERAGRFTTLAAHRPRYLHRPSLSDDPRGGPLVERRTYTSPTQLTSRRTPTTWSVRWYFDDEFGGWR